MALHVDDDSLTLQDPATLLADSFFYKELHVNASVLASNWLADSLQS